ncbi:unnamed protein product [Owenia fusiformis]|uniref:Uncharacterized protein n=1 Tax=Owenia fusiformis TaxID=6347 RepID=A0A8J1UW56_OWEFU|nr:unnamed protein product [Owenia fusiformis]
MANIAVDIYDMFTYISDNCDNDDFPKTILSSKSLSTLPSLKDDIMKPLRSKVTELYAKLAMAMNTIVELKDKMDKIEEKHNEEMDDMRQQMESIQRTLLKGPTLQVGSPISSPSIPDLNEPQRTLNALINPNIVSTPKVISTYNTSFGRGRGRRDALTITKLILNSDTNNSVVPVSGQFDNGVISHASGKTKTVSKTVPGQSVQCDPNTVKPVVVEQENPESKCDENDKTLENDESICDMYDTISTNGKTWAQIINEHDDKEPKQNTRMSTTWETAQTRKQKLRSRRQSKPEKKPQLKGVKHEQSIHMYVDNVAVSNDVTPDIAMGLVKQHLIDNGIRVMRCNIIRKKMFDDSIGVKVVVPLLSIVEMKDPYFWPDSNIQCREWQRYPSRSNNKDKGQHQTRYTRLVTPPRFDSNGWDRRYGNDNVD